MLLSPEEVADWQSKFYLQLYAGYHVEMQEVCLLPRLGFGLEFFNCFSLVLPFFAQ